MTSQRQGPGPPQARLLELAHLLVDCRGFYLTMFEDGLTNPQPGSSAAFDFASVESGPAGAWPGDFVTQPRALAMKLLRQQADYLTAMGTLLRADEVFDPLSTVLRGAFEYGARALWVMDPGVPHRTRCIRNVLMELVSLELYRKAISKMPDGPEKRAARAEAKARWENLTKVAAELFTDVQRADNAVDWVIEGASYRSWTDIAEDWGKLAGTPVDGRSIYELLSVQGHPQGFMATSGHFRINDEGGIAREADIGEVAKRAQLAVVSFYLLLTAMADYHSYQSDWLTKLESRIEAVFPAVWDTSPASPTA